MFNAYAQAGGNFIDSADAYQFGQSEELLGKLLHGRREDCISIHEQFGDCMASANTTLALDNALHNSPSRGMLGAFEEAIAQI